MADSVRVGDLATAVSNALRRDDRARLGAMVAQARQRAEQRALDASIPRPRQPAAVQPMPAPAARAIERLTRSNERLAKQTAALQAQADEALLRLADAIVVLRREVRDVARGNQAPAPGTAGFTRGRAGDAAVRRQIVSPKSRRLSERASRARETRLLAARTEIQKVTNIVNSLQAAAYGERGRLLATNNLMLVANQLFWSFLDPALQRLGVLGAGSATVLSAFAPLGNLISGALLLGGGRK